MIGLIKKAFSGYRCHHQMVLDLIKGEDHNVIIDMACGDGLQSRLLMSLGKETYGFDMDKDKVRDLNGEFPGHFFSHKISEGLCFPDKIKTIRFDTVVANQIIEHLFDPEAFLKDIREEMILSGGKYLIISMPYYGYFKNLLLSLMNRWDQHFMVGEKYGHIKFFSQKSASRMIKDNGFEVIAVKYCPKNPFLHTSMGFKCKISGDSNG